MQGSKLKIPMKRRTNLSVPASTACRTKLEFVAAVLALERQTIPPTINLYVPDPECDLDYVPGVARTGVKLAAAMSNSFAFGGTNAVLICRAVTH
jgi:3-oxoacyl-(acyl-carrier-protein) synthase